MIYVNEVKFSKEELRNVSHCIKSGWISSEGEFVKSFEDSFAKFCGLRYGVACSSGTSALHLGLLSIGIEKGDEVIVPAFTMIATCYALIYIGARPVLVDAEARTWNMDTAEIARKVNKRTKAILPVHIYGHPVDMGPIWEIARKKKLSILEDAAEAHGAEYRGIKAGALGDVAAFSFYANKIITTGEGGMVVTNDKRIAQKARYFRNMAFQKKRRFLHKDLGYNYRMTNLQAAVGLSQMSRIDKLVQKKRWIAAQYNKRLQEIADITTPIEESWAKNVYWMYSILIDPVRFGITRDKLMDELLKEGIETRAFFIPMHRQPLFNSMGLFRNERYPVSEDISRRGLYLPSGMTLDEDKIDFICKRIRKIKRKYS